ncbi:hypothetical protein CBR_g22357 [Chara braunii]|uniref:Uncharacterized protein n=1 Tax=Chara braunii TaxID=69332 RepID=A0A388JUV9_CHABU|nr:hypothetical protein CBR_g22357 [Chara braunii]|eukprot:GBG61560.1 hypothetical protein CBR_g22357 [Chara braunii]
MARSRTPERRRGRYSSPSPSRSQDNRRSHRGRSRSPRKEKSRSRSRSQRRRRAASESPKKYARPQREIRRNDFPPPGNRAWFTADMKEEIFALRRDYDKICKTNELLLTKIKDLTKVIQEMKKTKNDEGENKKEKEKRTTKKGHAKDDGRLSPAQVQKMIDKALETAIPKATGAGTCQQTQIVNTTNEVAQETNQERMEKLVSKVGNEVDEMKLMKFEMAAVKGAVHKINEPTRTCIPHVSSTVQQTRFRGMDMVASGSTGGALHTTSMGNPSGHPGLDTIGIPAARRPNYSAPSRPFPPAPKKRRTKVRRRISKNKRRMKRDMNFGIIPMTYTQFVRAHYTDLKDLYKMHNIRCKDKPQVIAALRRVPGLVEYQGRDFVHDSDKETQIEPENERMDISSTKDESYEEIESDEEKEEGEDEDEASESSEEEDSSSTSSSSQDIQGRLMGQGRRMTALRTRNGNRYID